MIVYKPNGFLYTLKIYREFNECLLYEVKIKKMWSAKFSLELCPTVVLKSAKINTENYKDTKINTKSYKDMKSLLPLLVINNATKLQQIESINIQN